MLICAHCVWCDERRYFQPTAYASLSETARLFCSHVCRDAHLHNVAGRRPFHY